MTAYHAGLNWPETICFIFTNRTHQRLKCFGQLSQAKHISLILFATRQLLSRWVKAAPAVMQYYFKENSTFTMQQTHSFRFWWLCACNDFPRWLLSAAVNVKAKVERNDHQWSVLDSGLIWIVCGGQAVLVLLRPRPRHNHALSIILLSALSSLINNRKNFETLASAAKSPVFQPHYFRLSPRRTERANLNEKLRTNTHTHTHTQSLRTQVLWRAMQKEKLDSITRI